MALGSRFEEFLAEAEGAKTEAESRLNLAINRAIIKEEEEARLEKQRVEQAAKQKELDDQQAELDRQAEEQRLLLVEQTAKHQEKIDEMQIRFDAEVGTAADDVSERCQRLNEDGHRVGFRVGIDHSNKLTDHPVERLVVRLTRP